MLLLKYLLLTASIGLFAAGALMLARELYRRFRPPAEVGAVPQFPESVEWRPAARLLAAAWLPLLLSVAIVVVPSGMAGVRVSQISGTLPTTLYPGTHFQLPFVHSTALYDVREQVFTAGGRESDESARKTTTADWKDTFTVQAKEGLNIGMSLSVRYRLDAAKLAHINKNLPHPVEKELVPPVVTAAFRELVPKYTVKEVFTSKREELQQRAHAEVTKRLAADGILVREIMVRDIQLPPEYAKAMEVLLLKERENETLNYEAEIKQKQVRIAELEAEAEKAREVKAAEASAQTRVVAAKGESDAMQYLLPLKEKQIQQSKLEAEARKEATVKNAEAAAAAKVIDSKAELERRNLLSEAEANRIRITAKADAERMQSEALVLKQSPLLINKIIAERLSDKVQIMMIPTDGRFFFNDVLKSGLPGQQMAQVADEEESQSSARK